MLARFKNRTVSIMRLSSVSGNRKALGTVTTADGDVQSMTTQYTGDFEGVEAKLYVGFFEIDVDINEGDVLRDHLTGRKYRVMATEKIAQNMGLQSDHMEVILERYTQ